MASGGCAPAPEGVSDFMVDFVGGGSCKLYQEGQPSGTANRCWSATYDRIADVSFTQRDESQELDAIPDDPGSCQTSRNPTSGESRTVEVSYLNSGGTDCLDQFTLSSDGPTCEIKITVKPASE